MLRQDASELVRRVEAGEEIIITVSCRPSARLVSIRPGRWRRRADLRDIFNGTGDPDWTEDRGLLDHDLRDPWARE